MTFGDWTKTGGGAGLHLSTDDLATFLVKLMDGALLSSGWVTSRSARTTAGKAARQCGTAP